ncbi:IS1239, transposase, putative [Streptococcus pneumoniae]|nr:IS1239, transposase, putative [Streptococcus pneumoniae]VTJ18676.1 IS1239, transposase, putative [Streptococcus pneumoniae]
MQNHYTTKAKHLTIDSRRLIERWKKEGKSNREIASLLGKAPQTIHTEIKRGTIRQCLGKGRFKEVYSADYAQQSYENNRKRSIKKSRLNKELKEKILHYHNQKFSPEMMVKAKGVNVGIFTIYYWIHHGKLGLSKQDLLYPRKGKSVKKQARLAPTLNLLVNPSNSGLKLSIFAWRMGIMRLIRFYLRERKTTACLS